MKVTMFWHGGENYGAFNLYSPKDAEVFSSVTEAKREFKRRFVKNDPFYPCVTERSEAWLFFGDKHPVLDQSYPDMILSFGPRKGIRISKG